MRQIKNIKVGDLFCDKSKDIFQVMAVLDKYPVALVAYRNTSRKKEVIVWHSLNWMELQDFDFFYCSDCECQEDSYEDVYEAMQTDKEGKDDEEQEKHKIALKKIMQILEDLS